MYMCLKTTEIYRERWKNLKKRTGGVTVVSISSAHTKSTHKRVFTTLFIAIRLLIIILTTTAACIIYTRVEDESNIKIRRIGADEYLMYISALIETLS